MGSLQITVFVILYVMSNNSIKAQSMVGDSCTIDSKRNGVCISIENCATALLMIRSGGKPKTCGFKGKTPIVCCENLAGTNPKSLAREKCVEYSTRSIPASRRSTRRVKTTGDGAPAMEVNEAIGGVDASPLEFPHMAILGYGPSNDIQYQCGGSLISEDFVLTAAHCLVSKNGNVSYVKLGVHRIKFVTQFIQTFSVKKVHRHPDYIPSQQYHDIALIELDHSADIQAAGVKPACLHTGRRLPENSFTATGWGATELYGDIHDTLQKVNLSYVPYEKCEGYYRTQNKLKKGLVDDWQICADGGGAVADTCQGDSGGPLQLPLKDRNSLHTIIGITSFGIKCAIVPAVYTRVSHYVPWIESIVWSD